LQALALDLVQLLVHLPALLPAPLPALLLVPLLAPFLVLIKVLVLVLEMAHHPAKAWAMVLVQETDQEMATAPEKVMEMALNLVQKQAREMAKVQETAMVQEMATTYHRLLDQDSTCCLAMEPCQGKVMGRVMVQQRNKEKDQEQEKAQALATILQHRCPYQLDKRKSSHCNLPHQSQHCTGNGPSRNTQSHTHQGDIAASPHTQEQEDSYGNIAL
jgi:hypothetical protein